MRGLARSILKARMRDAGIDKLFKVFEWRHDTSKGNGKGNGNGNGKGNGNSDRITRESKFSRAWRRHHYA